MTLREGVERRYTSAGHRAHYVDTVDRSWRSMCGRVSMVWLGTGTQDEYDRAAALPLCARCRTRAASWP